MLEASDDVVDVRFSRDDSHLIAATLHSGLILVWDLTQVKCNPLIVDGKEQSLSFPNGESWADQSYSLDQSLFRNATAVDLQWH